MAAQWRVAKSILDLLSEVNAIAPKRSRISDGTIGDADHQKRSSDHNPWVPPPYGGVVTAVDITHDPEGGLNARVLAEHLRKLGANGDKRVKYIISNRRIASSIANWTWRSYGGSNPHTNHLHLSVSSVYYDLRGSWGVNTRVPTEEEEVISMDTHGGTSHRAVNIWQRRLNQSNRTETLLEPDGYFGPQTEKAVKEYQSRLGLPQTGVIDLTTAVQLQAHAHGEGSHA